MNQHTEQLEIPGLLDTIRTSAAEATPKPRRQRIAAIPAETISLAILRVLARQNISFPQYCLMLAIRDAGGNLALARLSVRLGYSYHAVRQQVLRSNWFEIDNSGPLVAVSLAADGSAKLDRIHQLLAKDLEQ